MKKLKILLLNFEYPPLGGGASPVSKEIASHLSKNGHDLSVVTMGLETLPEYQESPGIKIYRIKCGRKKANISHLKEHFRYLMQAKKFLKSHLAENSYDVTHCHFILSTGILARWVKKNFGIPYIITAHGSDLPGYNPDRFQLIHWFSPYFIRKILADCEYIVSPSNYLGTLIQPFLTHEHSKLKIIPNGISIEGLPTSPKQKIILSTGRLLRRKGFHTLVKSVNNLASDYELHICGDGPMRKELEAMAKSSKMKVVFHGWIKNTSEKYQTLLASAAIYCLVSKFENASISLLEAMANGCAVITSDVTGCPETVGDAGICIAPEKPKILTEEIQKLILNPSKIEDLGKSARQRIEQKYLWEKIASSYEKLLFDAAR